MIQQDLPQVGGARQGLQAVAAGGDIVLKGAVDVRFQDVVGPCGIIWRKEREVAAAADAAAAQIAGQARTVQQPIQRGLHCNTPSRLDAPFTCSPVLFRSMHKVSQSRASVAGWDDVSKRGADDWDTLK